MFPHIGPGIVDVLRARQSSLEPAHPVLPKCSAAPQNTGKPISFRHITIEYAAIREREAEFTEAIHQYARIRRRDGAYRWGIFRNTEVADQYLEIFLVNSWAEHLRQHERQTKADRELERRLHDYLATEPEVRHLIDAYLKET